MLETLFLLSTITLNTDLTCLAGNIYMEARGEPLKGQVEVALVVKNRVEDNRWPNDYCKVIKQKGQFSWYKGQKTLALKDRKSWANSLRIASSVLSKDNAIENNGALFFINYKKAKYTRWTNRLTKTYKLGNHTFFKI